jgi:hypothetical protein
MTPFTFLIACFATYRISLLFTKEHGPWRLFSKLRRTPARHSATHEWLSCIFCFSMTGSAFVCGMLWLAGTRQHWAEWFMTWCALSAVTILLNQKFTKGEL